MNRVAAPVFAFGLAALAACSKPEPAPQTGAPAVETAAVAPAPADLAPAPAAATPAAAKNDPAVINFEGFGPAKFGADEEQVRMSWGRPLVGAPDPADGPGACYYLHMDPMPEKGGIAFMFEGAQFVRYDVDSSRHAAPGDLTVGMTAADVEARFPGRVESQPHKYDPTGRYLIVSPEDGGDHRLLFEVDGGGVITQWRIGRQPQVHYVEGCS